MKRHTIARVLLAVCILPLTLLSLGFLLPEQYSETYLGILPDKYQRLSEADGRRIIVVGGSSVPFSLNSGLLEQLLPGWTVVDFGLYARLGTTTMLDWAEQSIREGDLVILSPEQDAYALSCQADGESILQACDGSWHLLMQLKPERLHRAAAAFPAFAGKKLRYALLGRPEPADIYARASFDSYMDISHPDRERNILPGLWQSNQPIAFDLQPLPEDFIQEVSDFSRKIREKGAEVVYHFPPMNAAAVSAEPDHVDAWYDHLSQTLGIPILGDPHSCILDAGWFYDTNHHLNASGSLLFTRLLAEDIKLHLRDTTPTRLQIPEMPEPEKQVFFGDDSCEGCFLYRSKENGWVITGLSDSGRQKTALVLPTHHDGAPVTGIDPDALRGSTALRELTIQPNISALWDGMFDGCLSLTALHLTGPTPSAYSPGDGLMTGASFRIYVPAEALDAYRRSYSWQQYEAVLFPQ